MQNPLPLPIHSYALSSKAVGVERLVNCYAEVTPPQGKGATSIIRAPGTIPTTKLVGPGRGLYRYQGQLYAVAGASLYRITADGLSVKLGSITGNSVCTFADNATQLVICDPAASYVYDGAVNQITDPDFLKGIQCGVIDSYILFISPDGEFFCSDLAQASSYDALNFATAEGSPDKTVGLLVDHRQAILAGELTMEIWEDTAGTGFPFSRASNGLVELGCAAGYSLAKADNSLYWLANDLTVRRLDGVTGIRVSQTGLEEALTAYSKATPDEIPKARGFAYTQNGQIFYVLTVAGHTWVYSATTHEWHERESYGYTRWRPCATAFCYGRNYVQDFATGAVGWLDSTVFTEWGGPQVMSWTYPSIYDKGDLKFHQTLELSIDTGRGTNAVPNPKIRLECSDNGGYRFEHVEDLDLGAQGHFGGRVAWEQLGMADDRVYRNSISDAVSATVSDAQLTLS